MAKYVCLECGKTFDEPVCWREGRGEFWGVPCYEDMSGCPYCYGGYEEVDEDYEPDEESEEDEE